MADIMKKYSKWLAICFPFYVLLLVKTPWSFTGFYTDIIIFLTLCFYSIKEFFMIKTRYKIINTIITLSASMYLSCLILLLLFFTFSFSTNGFLKVRNLKTNWKNGFIELNYLSAMTGYGGGYGTYWQTKVFIGCPLIEYETNKVDFIENLSQFKKEEGL